MDQAYDNSGELMKTYRKIPNGMLKESNERRWGASSSIFHLIRSIGLWPPVTMAIPD